MEQKKTTLKKKLLREGVKGGEWLKTGLSMYSLVEAVQGAESSVDQFLQQAKKWNLEGVELLGFFLAG